MTEQGITYQELNKLLKLQTLDLYIMQGKSVMPLVDLVSNIVFYVNSLKGGFGKYIIDDYDSEDLKFELFNYKLFYHITIADDERNHPTNKWERWPCSKIWELEYDVTDCDFEVMEHICQLDFSESNSTQKLLEIIIAHLTEMVRRILKDSDPCMRTYKKQ